MSEEKKKESGKLSRRDFLKDAGLVIGGAAIGSTVLLAACAGEETTKTVTQTAPGSTVTAPGSTSTVTAPGATKTVTAPGATVTKTATVTTTVTGAPSGEITVLTPFGYKPPVQNVPLNPPPFSRLEDYNKVYLLDITFSGSYELVATMTDWFHENRPNVNLESSVEFGSYNVADESVAFQKIKDNWPSCCIVVGGH